MTSNQDEKKIKDLFNEGKVDFTANHISSAEVRAMAPGYFEEVDDDTLLRACMKISCEKHAMERKQEKPSVRSGKLMLLVDLRFTSSYCAYSALLIIFAIVSVCRMISSTRKSIRNAAKICAQGDRAESKEHSDGCSRD